jgi:colanic acid/amylovoran biosynthesis protein
LGKDPELSERVRVAFMKFIKWLTARGYGVLLIPQLFGNQNDIDYLRAFSFPDVFVMSQNYDTYFQQYVIGKLHSVIGMRYHSNIFAAKMGTPFIAIPYEEKMEGFLKLSGCEQMTLGLDNISIDGLIQCFEIIESGHDNFRNRLFGKSKSFRAAALTTTRAIAQMKLQ